ncbi:MAG: DUF4190 domain-containing protein [Pyrinomonadaceae bacterium]
MKKCPTCNKVFSEEALQFCSDDGTILEPDSGPASAPDLMATMMSPSGFNPYVPPSPGSSPGSSPGGMSGEIPGSAPIAPAPWDKPKAAWELSADPSSIANPVKPQNLYALGSMILGILSLIVGFVGSAFCFLCGFTGVPAVIAGAIALILAIKSPERYSGKVFAIVGIAAGVIALLLPAFWWILSMLIYNLK